MTVAELVAILNTLPQSADVVFHDEEIAVMRKAETVKWTGPWNNDVIAQINGDGIYRQPKVERPPA